MSYKLEHVAEALGLVFDRSQLHLGYYDAEIAGTIFLKLHYLRNIPIQTVQ
jgi:DNA polymerase III epsilon subunit-like protein